MTTVSMFISNITLVINNLVVKIVDDKSQLECRGMRIKHLVQVGSVVVIKCFLMLHSKELRNKPSLQRGR